MDYQLHQNYFIPVYRRKLDEKEIEYAKEYINNILDQQILISQLSSGISYKDTEDMDEYERSYILGKLIQMKKDELEAREKAINEARNKQKY